MRIYSSPAASTWYLAAAAATLLLLLLLLPATTSSFHHAVVPARTAAATRTSRYYSKIGPGGGIGSRRNTRALLPRPSPSSSQSSTGIISPSLRSTSTRLMQNRKGGGEVSGESSSSQAAAAAAPPADPTVVETSDSLRRVSWFSWWSQVILSTVSGVILVFVKNVFGRHSNSLQGTQPNFILSSVGLIVSAVSITWTWGNGARLSRRLIRKNTTPIQAATLLRRAIRVGVTLNLVGLLLNLLAAEQIVGSLAIKVMTNRPLAAQPGFMTAGLEGLQPLDILVVQANTNVLLSNFCSLVCLLFLTKRVNVLDPPSTEDDPRI